jgi:pimeloyl-ACP methyl ester carboxylesterase
MLERVYFNTEDEIELVGLLERPTNPTKRVVISVHGMQSNCLKRREDILSKEISNAGVAYFAFNNRGAELMTYTRKTTGEKILNGGSVYEDVLDGYYDIKGAINKMLELGYTDIYLQGHSLGCTKIVYTYNKLKNENNVKNIKGIMLLSLVDIPDCQKYDLGDKYAEMMKYAENKEKEGKLNDLMPIESFDHPICVRSYLRYFKYNKDIDFARFWDKDYNFKELNNIQIPLFLRWGNVHDLVLQNLSNLIEILKSKIQNEKLDIGYIDGADHGYTGKEETLAKEIISFIG